MNEYLVWSPDYDQTIADARRIKAYDMRAAAEEWAEWYDSHSAEYSIVGGQGADITVAEDFDNYREETFRVEGEAVPMYRARKMFGQGDGK